MKLSRKSTTALLVLCTTSSLLISGCSSSDKNLNPSSNAASPSEQKNPAIASTTIIGNVIKGTVKNADVNFYLINENKIGNSPFARTKTDANGNFTLVMPNGNVSDSIFIEVSGAADGSSKMVCDAEICGVVGVVDGEDADGSGSFEFGEDITVSDDFRLSTIVSDYKNSPELRVSVTPISHFAVQRAKKKGDLSYQSIKAEMKNLADLLKLPKELSQVLAVDITRTLSGDLDRNSVRYSLYSAAVAAYAHKHRLPINAAIEKIDAELFDAAGNVNRELLLELLGYAHKEAQRIAKGAAWLENLLTEILLVINDYECAPMGADNCGPIGGGNPPPSPAGELPKIKQFVKDFRVWVRDLTMQNNPALANFSARSRMVGKVWEDDIKVLGSALNDVLPGIAQAVSPAYQFCYYCEAEGVIFAAAIEKELTIGDLHYHLGGDGTLDIEGRIRDVDVDIQLQLPSPEDWSTSHSIDVAAGRLSRNNMDLVISKGSTINAVFNQGVRVVDLLERAQDDQVPVATQLTAAIKFGVNAEYGIAPGGTVDFESAATSEWLDTADWNISPEKSRSGTRSLKSPATDNNETSRASAAINTWGGYLSFDYAVESEAGYDFFNVYVDGERVLSVSGYQPEFKSANIFLAPGEHTIIWEYSKDASVGHNKDAVWLDDIQFPVLAADNTGELVSRNILSGTMSVTAYKLNQPWQFTSQTYLPGDIRVNAIFSNEFIVANEIEEDEIELNVAARIANAAEFEPPQPYDEGTLAVLGNYTVSDRLFTFNLQSWSIRITPAGGQTYLYEVYRTGESTPIQSYTATSTGLTMKDVAGDLIENSGIGMHVIVPQEGLYITTLLKSSPWGTYKNSRFSAEGGNIYGYLAEPFDPTETAEQFLKVSASFEMELKPYDLPHLIFGSSLTRDTLNEGSFEFYLIVDGQRFNFSSQYWYNLIGFGNTDVSVDLKSPKLTVENQDGVTLELLFPNKKNGSGKDEPPVEGTLNYNGKTYGTIKRVKGITTVEYIDNTGESIN